MPQNPSEQEPSIEEILASIRQIISDDDDDKAADSIEEEVVDDPIRHESNNVLELTEEDLVEEKSSFDDDMEVEMVDRYEEDDDEPLEEDDEPEVQDLIEEIRRERAVPRPDPAPRPVPSEILSSGTQAAALSSITKLASKMPINNSRSYDGITLEDIVREMLHPMLREWMDDNLPPMVERIVQKELEKLARRAMDD